jgi:hypothetical protein
MNCGSAADDLLGNDHFVRVGLDDLVVKAVEREFKTI